MLRPLRALTVPALVALSATLSCSDDAGTAGERPNTGGAGGSAGTGGNAGTAGGGPCTAGQTQSCYTGPPATQGIGACKDGTQTCSAGSFGACVGEVLPLTEACDGNVDEDCDGTVDEGCTCTTGETRQCYGGPQGTLGVGTCTGGTQSCVGGTWGACNGAVLPTAESCNDLDDDCNGKTDEGAGLKLYSLPFGSKTWSVSYLSDMWNDANAPPCSDIAAAVQLSDFARLLVFTVDGTLYTRKSSVWQPPLPATTRFSGLPKPVDAVYHIPHAWSVNFNPSAPVVESLTFTSKPNYYIYDYTPQDTANLTDSGVIPKSDPPGPDRANGRDLWSFERMDLSKLGTGAAFVIHTEFDDGNAYTLDAAFVWQKWPTAQSPNWAGKANAPPVQQCVAAFFDQAKDTVTLICP